MDAELNYFRDIRTQAAFSYMHQYVMASAHRTDAALAYIDAYRNYPKDKGGSDRTAWMAFELWNLLDAAMSSVLAAEGR